MTTTSPDTSTTVVMKQFESRKKAGSTFNITNQEKTKSTRGVSLQLRTHRAEQRWTRAGSRQPIKAASNTIQNHSSSVSSSDNSVSYNMANKLYSRKGVTDPNGTAARQFRLLLEDDAGKLFDDALQIYNRCKITPFQFVRTQEQKNNMWVIKNRKQWSNIKETIRAEVEGSAFMSFDTEDFLPDHKALKIMQDEGKQPDWTEEGRLVYVTIGTLTGKVVTFDMDCLHEAYRATGEKDPSVSIPKEVLQWLRSGGVMVVGSNVKGDCQKLGLEAVRMADTASVFKEAMNTEYGGRPLVDIQYKARDGLGAQSYFSKQHDYKPMQKKKFEERYGPHTHKNSKGKVQWPDCRTKVNLYKWKKELGSLPEESLFYLYHDGSSPASLVAALTLESMFRGILKPVRQVRLASVAADLMGPTFESTVAEVVFPAEVQPRITPAKRVAEQSTSTGSSSKRTRTKAVQTDEDEVQVLGHAPRMKAGTSFQYFDNEIRRVNMYKHEPKFPHVCFYCGSSNHSKLDDRGRDLCPKYKADKGKGIRRCEYEKCRNPTKHYTMMCGQLHKLCHKCLHRGHGASDDCLRWGERRWSEALRQFESAAKVGVWTRNRATDERWGFWSHRMGTAYPFYTTYKKILDRARRYSVFEVDRKLGLRGPDGKLVTAYANQ